jgi:hypothetical protein
VPVSEENEAVLKGKIPKKDGDKAMNSDDE